jgi:type 1 glutamine amidotransferase
MKFKLYPFNLQLLLAFTVLIAACGSDGALIQRYESETATPTARILFLAGRDSHGPWAHEHKAGSLLFAEALHWQQPNYAIDVVYGGWPSDRRLFNDVDTLVFYGDGGSGHLMVGHSSELVQMLEDKVGVVALHYAVEVPKASDAATAMLSATGGYFETHWSVNPLWQATFQELPEHPITRGLMPFTMDDEWYFNMRFQPDAGAIEPLLLAVPPLQTVERDNGPHSGNEVVRKMVADEIPQVLAWTYSRPQGGRGFGYTGGHYHANWENPNAQQLILNAIVWTAQGRTGKD